MRPRGVAGQRVVGRQVGCQEPRDVGHRQTPERAVATDERELETQLVNPVPAARCRAGGALPPSGRVASRLRPRGRRRRRPDRPRSNCCQDNADPRAVLSSRARSGVAKSVDSMTEWMSVPTRVPAGMPESSRGTAARPRSASPAPAGAKEATGSSSPMASLVGLAAHGLVVACLGDARVRHPSPDPVEHPVEAIGLQLWQLRPSSRPTATLVPGRRARRRSHHREPATPAATSSSESVRPPKALTTPAASRANSSLPRGEFSARHTSRPTTRRPGAWPG